VAAIDKAQLSEMNALNWDQFQSTEQWADLFDNLGRVSFDSLASMLGQLEDLKAAFGDEGAEAVKEIIAKIRELREEIEKRDPFTAIRDGFKQMRASIDAIRSTQATIDHIKESLRGTFTNEEIENTKAYKDAVDANIKAQTEFLRGSDSVKTGWNRYKTPCRR
jgi:cell fate (sporulation/competence/biofilm development) regulator YlbF (YheA/YmcA/DUF963 family)